MRFHLLTMMAFSFVGVWIVSYGAWVYLAPGVHKGIEYWKNRKEQFQREEQWPDGLILMASALRAGLTLDQAFHLLRKQSPEPLRSFLERQFSPGELEGLASSKVDQLFSDPSLVFVRHSWKLAHQMGAPYAGVLISCARQLRQKHLFKKKVMALTAQSRLTARLVAMSPVFFGLTLALISPDFVKPLVTSSQGRTLLVGVGMMNLTGLWIIYKMMRWLR